MVWKIVVVILAAAAAAEVSVTAYFYMRTMKRANTTTGRTMKMAGTDWDQYMPFIEERKERLLAQEHEDVYLMSDDGLKLHATWFPNGNPGRVMIGFHGYTSRGMSDFIGLSDYYLRNGYSMLLPDARAHGDSEGEYIGFGCLDRFDALKWINWVVGRCGEDVQIALHGISMGGSTVLMASGQKLPPQVKGIVSDCAFISPKEVFTHVLNSMYHIPASPILIPADALNKKKAGYGLDDCRADVEVRKAQVPILLIHGDKDTFVPCEMCEEIYKNCPEGTEKLIIPGAAHAESYYKETETYEEALGRFYASCGLMQAEQPAGELGQGAGE